MTTTNTLINWSSLQTAVSQNQPFPYMITSDIIAATAGDNISRDFPSIDNPGSFPCAVLHYGDYFARFLEEIQSDRMRRLMEEKLNVNLNNAKTMVTVRGHCRSTDGKIHIDSKGKLVTVLIYMNDSWENSDGRLRLLNSCDSLDDYFAEAPATKGTMVAFACTSNAWHGHSSFAGERRTIQLNWVTGDSYLRREKIRHTISATAKKVKSFFFNHHAASY